MNRTTQRKLSRALIGGLGLTLALGGVFWLGKIVGTNSSATQAKVGRGETTEAAVLAKSAADHPTANNAATPTTKPAGTAGAHDAFASNIAGASVLQTPTSPVASSSTTQPSGAGAGAGGPTMLAAISGGASTTQPDRADAHGTASAIQAAAHQRDVRGQLAGAVAAGATQPPQQQDLIVGNPIAEAKSRLEHGKTLEARKILNTAITNRQLSDVDTKAAKQMLDEINAVVVFSTKQFRDDEYGGTFTVPSGGVLEKIAKSNDVSRELLQKINGISDPRRLRAEQNLKIIKGPFNAVVDKSDFTLELWLGEPNAKGSMYVTTLPVGLGEDGSTPTGVWAVQNRLTNPAYYSPRGEGVIPADDPKNPLGEHWIGLSGIEGGAVGKQSYGIHGTIDPDSIGKQASMGCIRLRAADIARVYDALVEGKSTVTVKD